MTEKKSLSKRLSSFIFGEPIPVLSETDIDILYGLDGKIDNVLAQLNDQQGTLPQLTLDYGDNEAGNGSSPALTEQSQVALDDLSGQVRKLAKTQFKTNTLQESQLSQQQETLNALQESFNQRQKKQEQQQQQAIETAQLALLKSLLPVLDSLDAAFDSGRRQVLKQAMPAETRQAIVAWLDGVRLARMRMLDILQSYEVTPIATVGRPFDPNRHVAITTDSSKRAANGIIIGEDRRGYETPQKVLRFADVIVAQSN